MKNVLLAILLALGITACGAPAANPPVEPQKAIPGGTYSFAALLAPQVPCGTDPLVWTIAQQVLDTSWATVDGNITQDGVWTAPDCGSTYMGLPLTIQAKCVASGKVATATASTAPEVVTGATMSFAIATTGTTSCLLSDPTNITNVPPGSKVSFYSTVTTTCGAVVSPAPPIPLPAVCGNTPPGGTPVFVKNIYPCSCGGTHQQNVSLYRNWVTGVYSPPINPALPVEAWSDGTTRINGVVLPAEVQFPNKDTFANFDLQMDPDRNYNCVMRVYYPSNKVTWTNNAFLTPTQCPSGGLVETVTW